MAASDNADRERDIFAADLVYPDAASVFTWHPSPLESIKSECLIVLDTNVLLVPYDITAKSLGELENTYRMLVGENRLIVPGQVAREFAKRRATKLTELHKNLSNKKSKAIKLRKGAYPLLGNLAQYRNALEIEGKIDELIDQYHKALGDVLDHVREWTWDDPLSRLYGDLFGEEVVVDPEFDKDKITKDLAWRKIHNVPPGYKDAGKDDSGVGDILIWHTILRLGEERKKSLVFVSGEEKADWWHQSNGGPLYPRYELVNEYRRHSQGQSFHILNLSALLELYGADHTAVEEVRKEEITSARKRSAHHRGNALSVPLDVITVVRRDGNYGAVRLVDQVHPDRGGYVRYQWWYQPDGSDSFTNSTVQTGFGEAAESWPGKTLLEIGPFELEWSGASDGLGYIYFRTWKGPNLPWDEYELALTYENDISKVRASRLDFWRAE